MDPISTPAALFVAHPGHELRVHGWLETARPFTFVLTDGSGAQGGPRLASTLGVLDHAGAQPGPIFGRLTDRAAYEAVLACDFGLFIDLAREVAAFLVRNRIATIVGDAREGYNPVHDVARAVIDTAVRVAASEGHAVRNLDFLVVGLPGDGAAGDGARVIPVELDAAALARKLEAARGFRELEAEVQSCLARFGPAAFRVEHLREVAAAGEALSGTPPLYESFGAARVAEGRYAKVLRYADHVLPLVRAIERQAPA
jgi:hypothetical protein